MQTQIGFPLFFKLIKGNTLFLLGAIFTLLSIIVMVPTFMMVSSFIELYQKYDHELIYSKGTEKEAVVDKMTIKTNVNINGENPVLISYSYKDNGQEVHDKFETFDLNDKYNTLSNDLIKIHDPITIKVYNSQSAIVGLEPFVFPFKLFYIFFIFPLVGIILLIIGMMPGLKIYRVYKNGKKCEATIYDLSPITSGFFLLAKRKAAVNYHYLSKNGTKLAGEAMLPVNFLVNHVVGDTLTVYVSAGDENRSYPSPKYLFK
ncbi:hypothetical protein [Flavobacterium sp. C4GT6]|uniref:hypothetical protein n=1 Tax=Flavobacterium sp. C4GT6 TaxID=3103818 RepID=UPI002ED5AF94